MGQGAAPAEWPPSQYGPEDQPVAGRPYLTSVPGTHEVQSVEQGVVTVDDDPNRIEFLGETFGLAESIGLMPMLAFANASKAGLDSDDMAGLSAMYALIRDVIDQRRPPKIDPATGQQVIDATGEPEWDGPSEWMRFEKHAIEQQADGEELMEFVGKAMAAVSARPRKRRERSSASSPRILERSKDSSSSPGMPPEVAGLVPVARVGH
jgi:hypothetical protein